MHWSDIVPSLSQEIINILLENNFLRPTPVQIATIPQFLSRKDVAVEAVTGSGKTLAFLIPVFQMLLLSDEHTKGNKMGALIVEPTRELALQTFLTAKPFADKLGFTLCLLTGGSSAEEQEASLGGSNVVVGTPGRLASFLSQSLASAVDVRLSVRSLEVLILDEADRLYSLGQAETVRTIIASLPKQRRTGLFSATLAESADVLAEAGLRNPVTIKLNSNVTGEPSVAKVPIGLSTFYAKVGPADKFTYLVSFLKSKQKQKHIVFFPTCAAVEYFSTVLRRFLGEHTPILWIHGKIDKLSRREKIFRRFQMETSGVLISTDLMSRGVDFPDVDWVLQFDAPSSPATFVHRCGRTARLDRIGSAVLFLLPNEIDYVRFIEKNQGVLMSPIKMSEFGDIPDSADVLNQMRQLCIADRDVFDKSARAFVSFIQFYRKHECSLIFQLKELNIGLLAYSYGLLQMPRMPDLRTLKGATDDFHPADDIKTNDIQFKDAGREKQRLEMLSKKSKDKALKGQVDHGATSSKQKQHVSVSKKKSKEKMKKLAKAKRKAGTEDSDWEELANDARLIKRLKSGKMSEKEFERAMGLSSEEDG